MTCRSNAEPAAFNGQLGGPRELPRRGKNSRSSPAGTSSADTEVTTISCRRARVIATLNRFGFSRNLSEAGWESGSIDVEKIDDVLLIALERVGCAHDERMPLQVHRRDNVRSAGRGSHRPDRGTG